MGKFRWTRGNVALLVAIALAAIVVIVVIQHRSQPQNVDLSTMLATIKSDIAHKKVDTLLVDTSTLTLVLVATLVGLGYFLLRRLGGMNGQALSFGKSRARMFMQDKPSVTFADV